MTNCPKEVVIYEDNERLLSGIREILGRYGHTIIAECKNSGDLIKFLSGFSGPTENLVLVADGDTDEESDQTYINGAPPPDEIRNKDGANAIVLWTQKFPGNPPYTLGRAAFGSVPGAKWQLSKKSGDNFVLAEVLTAIPDVQGLNLTKGE